MNKAEFLAWAAEVMGYEFSEGSRTNYRGRLPLDPTVWMPPDECGIGRSFDPHLSRDDFQRLLERGAENGVDFPLGPFVFSLPNSYFDCLFLPLSPYSADYKGEGPTLCELLDKARR